MLLRLLRLLRSAAAAATAPIHCLDSVIPCIVFLHANALHTNVLHVNVFLLRPAVVWKEDVVCLCVQAAENQAGPSEMVKVLPPEMEEKLRSALVNGFNMHLCTYV